MFPTTIDGGEPVSVKVVVYGADGPFSIAGDPATRI